MIATRALGTSKWGKKIVNRNYLWLLGVALGLFAIAQPANADAARETKLVTMVQHSPTVMSAGETGRIQVNVGSLGGLPPGSGSLAIAIELPEALTATNTTGSGWSCTIAPTGPDVSCSRTSYNNVALVVTVDIANPAPSETGIVKVATTFTPAGAPPEVEHVEHVVGFGEMDDTFAINTFGVKVAGDNTGAASTQAAEHPYSAYNRISFRANQLSNGFPTLAGDQVRLIDVQLPPGFVADPNSLERCPRALFSIGGGGGCPGSTVIGKLMASFGSGAGDLQIADIYNLEPPPGMPAQFGSWITQNGQVFFDGSLMSEEDFGMRVQVRVPQLFEVFDSIAYFYGDPGIQHPAQGGESRAMFTQPMDCRRDDLFTTRANVVSWLGFTDHAVVDHDLDGVPLAVENCEAVPAFDPSFDLKLSDGLNVAESPTGLDVDMHLPHNIDEPEELATPTLKKAVVELPDGLTVNPSAADGLASCTLEQMGYKGNDFEYPNPIRFRDYVDAEQSLTTACPEASRLGELTVETNLIDETLAGSIYLAAQEANPFGTLMGLYLVVESRERGIVLKLPGRVDPDPATGKVKATFDYNPPIPFTDMKLHFFGGPRAPLATPAHCGVRASKVDLAPWSMPDDPASRAPTIQISAGPNGTPCVENEAARPFGPGFNAGMGSAEAGAHSQLVTVFSRTDADQEIGSVQVKMPGGLLAKLRGVELCPAAQADAGECPEASRIGHTVVSAGAGPSPLWMPQPGKDATAVYLSGPYRGAPYSLSVMVPAQAGPFDLGKVVVRTQINVDERTAELTVPVGESRVYNRHGALTQALQGAVPHIIEGVPLRIREMRVIVDRDEFMLNPTKCSEQWITGSVASTAGKNAPIASRFQATGCASLGFGPRFRAKILDKGRRSTLRSWHPRTRFAVVPRPGHANIGGARVALPSSTILDQGNIGTTCTRAQMAARDCPERSVVGYARAWSPLLNRAIQGPVYLAANGGVRPLPDLAAVLDGEVRIMLLGEISTLRTGGRARLQNTFRIVPDAPVSRFVLTMRGGRDRGLLVNSKDLCRTHERGVAAFFGQNGKRHRLRPRVEMTFKGCRQVRRRVLRRAVQRKAARRTAGRNAQRTARRSVAAQLPQVARGRS